MKNIFCGILLVIGFNTYTYSQSVCFTWKHDYGSAQDARINSLKHEIQSSRYDLNSFKNNQKYNSQMMVSRTYARSANLAKQLEHQRLSNRIYKDRLYPIFDMKRSDN